MNQQPARRRILSIDGGGTRGYIALLILEKLQQTIREIKKLGPDVKVNIADYFDLVCGTSTGGIIALGLQSGKTVEDLKNLYKLLAKHVFGGVKGWEIPIVGSIPNIPKRTWEAVTSWGMGYYSAGDLEALLKSEFGERKLKLSADHDLKVFVVAADNNNRIPKEYLFRNYPVQHDMHSEETPVPLYMGSVDQKKKCTIDVPIWKAARACSAAPTYFAPFKFGDKEQGYTELVDGGVVANNPTEIAFHEASLLWRNDLIDVVVSVGTGVNSTKAKGFETLIPWVGKFVAMATDSTKTNRNFRRWRGVINKDRAAGNRLMYKRFNLTNVPFTEKLDYWSTATFGEWDSAIDEFMNTDASFINDMRAVAEKLELLR